MSIGRKGTGTVAALAAALVLVLQSVFGAAAMGAGPIQRDIFGNAICVGGEAQHSPANGPDGGHMPDCCMLGCSISAQLLANAPEDAERLFQPREFAAIAIRPLPATPALDDPGRQPGNPRAPPFTA